jgi:predicted phosphodiesterase
MRIAVISDLHLGPGDATDAFGHEDDDFLRFLRHLEGEFERIVLLGDIWETLTGHGYGDPARELRRAREAHPRIASRFERSCYAYVHGNHDIVAGRVDRAPERLLLDADGVRLLFTHGHHHDWVLRRARWVSEVAVWLGGWLRRLGFEPFYRLLEKLEQDHDGSSLDAGLCSFRRWAVEHARSLAADVVITGHTHKLARSLHGDQLFLNSGTCKDGRYGFLSLDTRASRFEVHTQWR